MTLPPSFGLERCLQDPPAILHGRRFGLVANQASVDATFAQSHTLLAARFPGQLAALFGPQHGFLSEQQDNMIETADGYEPRLGIPVFSLYGEHRKPTPAMLTGLDLLVIDLQDVGCRVYTYMWTLLLCLEACAEARIPVLVLDRPNPLGCDTYEGALLDPDFASFVGSHPIPMRHGLTLGQLALLFNAERGIGADVHVLAMRGVDPRARFDQLGRAWLPPSPNLPRFEGVLTYPGQVLLEGTNLSEGRGTTTPFEVCGAPFVDAYRLADMLRERDLPGVVFRPVRFEPTFQKWHGQSCGGVFLHVIDPAIFRPYLTTLHLLACVRAAWPTAFAWREPPYEYETVKLPIDILTGGTAVRLAVDSGADVAPLAAVDATAWRHRATR